MCSLGCVHLDNYNVNVKVSGICFNVDKKSQGKAGVLQ